MAEEPVEIAIPIIPTLDLKLVRVDENHGWIVWANILSSGKLVMDRSQCIGLGSALIKMGNSMPRADALVVEEHGGLILPSGN